MHTLLYSTLLFTQLTHTYPPYTGRCTPALAIAIAVATPPALRNWSWDWNWNWNWNWTVLDWTVLDWTVLDWDAAAWTHRMYACLQIYSTYISVGKKSR